MLAALNTLFVAFVLVQLRVFFGGQAYVREVTGLTLAEYARSGFFVLVAVAALVVVTLLACDGLLSGTALGALRIARRLATSLTVLVAIVMVSAMARMGLYMKSFGLSADRLYATAAMCWIAALLVMLRLTVLRERSRAFTIGALRAGWVTLLALAAMNPDAVIVRANAALADRVPFDYAYARNVLSADAVPSLVDVLTSPSALPPTALPNSSRCDAAPALLRQYLDQPSPATTWTLGRSLAKRSVRARADALRATCTSTRAGST
jgi:hypothetical protein